MIENIKYTVLAAFLLSAVVLASCNPADSRGKGNVPAAEGEKGAGDIVFREYEHDFGKLTEGEKVAHIFSFVNNGAGDLVISSASASCGCTVPKYDRKPIPPGEGGTLEVVFDTSGRSGVQTKTISVRSNSPSEVVILKISAEVLKRN